MSVLCSAAPIHLDDVDCSNADRFEDCYHRGWGVHNCFARDSIGLVCNPGPDGMSTTVLFSTKPHLCYKARNHAWNIPCLRGVVYTFSYYCSM